MPPSHRLADPAVAENAEPAAAAPRANQPRVSSWRAVLVILVLIGVAGPWGRADVALVAGIVIALAGAAEFVRWAGAFSKRLIQICVVLLGLRLDLAMLRDSVVDGLGLAVGTILGAVVVGLLLGRILRTGRETSTLITCGTAICGGSAIVAVGGAIGASASVMAVAIGAIFCLNAIGLWLLPIVGHALALTDVQFGQWAGVALHDIASVGGAARPYGGAAFEVATVVKLTRVVWITPLALLAPWFVRGGSPTLGHSPFPWFIVGFVLASVVRTAFQVIADWGNAVAAVSGVGFQAALFMIGLGISRRVLRKVGWRALVQATVLWLLMAGVSLAVIAWSPTSPAPAEAAPDRPEARADPESRVGTGT